MVLSCAVALIIMNANKADGKTFILLLLPGFKFLVNNKSGAELNLFAGVQLYFASAVKYLFTGVISEKKCLPSMIFPSLKVHNTQA